VVIIVHIFLSNLTTNLDEGLGGGGGGGGEINWQQNFKIGLELHEAKV
jgi:hypothetical protein